MTNVWMENASVLRTAYARHNDGVLGTLRQRLLGRGLALHLPSAPQRIIDIGGGEGHQAVSLARAGHRVVLLDPDPAMLDAARHRLEFEDHRVRDRVTLRQGYGENATELVEGDFDLVCCHGILLYVDDAEALLRSAVRLARPGGLVSVLASNADAVAMRPALQGSWAAALRLLQGGADEEDRYLPGHAHTPEAIAAILASAGAPATAWYGIRIFSDHLGDVPPGPDFDQLCELEWVAGTRDPYRRLARLFHVIALRAG